MSEPLAQTAALRLAGLFVLGTAVSAALILLLRPLLLRYAMARPSARGLHLAPTPQGGGLAVLGACAMTSVTAAVLAGYHQESRMLATVLAAAAGLAVLGFVDDVRPLPALPRLVVQCALMAVGVWLLPDHTRVLPWLPFGLERVVLVVAGAWFINLTNFMDGMDWITVADGVPVTVALVCFWAGGTLPPVPGLIALGLLAGLLGYAPFNKPPARLFLGDVGSLPIGFLLAYGLFSLAGQSGGGMPSLAAAVLLPLYPIADSGLTLLWRLGRRERIWEPHRTHYYQVAVLRGLTVWHVLARIAVANAVLAGAAWICVVGLAPWWLLSLIGVATVAATLASLVLPSVKPKPPEAKPPLPRG